MNPDPTPSDATLHDSVFENDQTRSIQYGAVACSNGRTLTIMRRPTCQFHWFCVMVAMLVITGLTAKARAQTSPPGAGSSQVPTISPNPRQSPRLQVQPQVNALPEGLHNPPKAQAPAEIHTGDWGVFNREGGSAAGFGPVARYGTDPSAEDWSFLRDPTLSDDIFDPLKFIPLNTSKSIYLTLSGDERLKNWFENRPFLGTQKPNDSGRMTVRGLYGADLHLGPFFRVFAELVNGDAAGWNAYGYNGSYRTKLDLEQLFGEVTLPLAGARTGLKFGRQQFLDAPNYVLFARETPDVPLSWNGVRAYAIWPRVRIDLFDFVQTNNNPTQLFRDNENWNARLFGGYESWAPPDFHFLGRPGHVFVDFFYLGYEYGGTTAAIPTASGTASGSTLRDNYGTRVWGKAGPGRVLPRWHLSGRPVPRCSEQRNPRRPAPTLSTPSSATASPGSTRTRCWPCRATSTPAATRPARRPVRQEASAPMPRHTIRARTISTPRPTWPPRT